MLIVRDLLFKASLEFLVWVYALIFTGAKLQNKNELCKFFQLFFYIGIKYFRFGLLEYLGWIVDFILWIIYKVIPVIFYII